MTAPTITWGHGKLYDFNTTNAALEASWTKHENGNVGTYTIDSFDYVKLHITGSGGAKEYYIDNNAALSNTSEVIAYRYKTDGPQAKIVAVFAGGNQTVLDHSYASTWKYGTATLDTAKGLLNQIRLYADTATGDVYYDFILLCKGIFTFPQYDRVQFDYANRYNNTEINNRIGRRKDWMGADEVIIMLDGPIDHDRGKWERPQLTQPKDDTNAAQVLEDIHHNAYAEAWQWFTHDRGALKVVLENLVITEDGERPYLYAYNAVLSEVRVGKGQNETYTERLSIA